MCKAYKKFQSTITFSPSLKLNIYVTVSLGSASGLDEPENVNNYNTNTKVGAIYTQVKME